MAATLLSDLSRATDSNSDPLSGATWTFYATGTTTPQAAYTSAALTTPHANPVVADSGGLFAPIFLDDSLVYRGVLKTAAGATLQDIDPINNSIAAALAAGGGSALIGFIQAGTGAVARTLEDKARETITVADFGAVGDGATNNDAALAAVRAYAAMRSAAGNTVRIIWPAGRYIFTDSPNWAINRLHMLFEGEVWLINTGVGSHGLKFDGGPGPIPADTGAYGLRILGYPQIYGASNTGHSIYCRAVHRSHMELNLRGGGAGSSGFYGEWLVSNTIFLIMNFNEGGLYSAPARGITLTIRNANEDSSYNNFHNIEMSGLPVAVYMDGALGNSFFGGAIQANTVGLQTTANAWENKFFGTDFEANGTDVTDAARETQFYGCDFEDGPTFTATAVNSLMLGGVTESITIASGAAQVLLNGVTYNRFGSGAISDAGTRTMFSNLRNKGAGETHDAPRAEQVLTLSGSPYTYTNTTGGPVRVAVTGGTVSAIKITHLTQFTTGETAGIFVLGRGDAIEVTYSVAPTITVLKG